MPRKEKVMSEVNHLFDAVEKVLRQTAYDQLIHPADQENFRVAMTEWQRRNCHPRTCGHRGDTCRFLRVDLSWLTNSGFTDLCDFLHPEPGKLPRHFDALRTHWARQPGHFNP